MLQVVLMYTITICYRYVACILPLTRQIATKQSMNIYTTMAGRIHACSHKHLHIELVLTTTNRLKCTLKCISICILCIIELRLLCNKCKVAGIVGAARKIAQRTNGNTNYKYFLLVMPIHRLDYLMKHYERTTTHHHAMRSKNANISGCAKLY